VVVDNVEYAVEHGHSARIDTRSGSTTAKIHDTWYVQISQSEPCPIADHSADELVAIVQATLAVVIMNLLHGLGLPLECQQAIIREHQQLRRTVRMSNKWFGAQEM